MGITVSLQLCQHKVLLNLSPIFYLTIILCFDFLLFSNRGQQNWLQLDHRVLDHDLPKKPGPTILYFAVRYVSTNTPNIPYLPLKKRKIQVISNRELKKEATYQNIIMWKRFSTSLVWRPSYHTRMVFYEDEEHNHLPLLLKASRINLNLKNIGTITYCRIFIFELWQTFIITFSVGMLYRDCGNN